MSFDSVFHGAPASNDGQSVPSGQASLGIDTTAGQLYYRTPALSGWTALGSPSTPSLLSGSPAQAGDLLSVSRAGANVSVPVSSMAGVLNFGVSVQGLTTTGINVAAGSGDVDVFTVPAGKRALCVFNYFNSAGTTTTIFSEVKIGGVYYRANTNSTVGTLTNSSSGYLGIVLEAGDSFAQNCSQAGMNFFGTAFVFPNTNGLKTVRVTTGLQTGDNTIYTCPVGKTASISLSNNQITGSSSSALAPALFNTSGGTLSFFFNIVKFGDAPSTANKAFPTTVVLNNNAVTGSSNFTLNAGDYISVNSSGPHQGLVWLTIQEIPV